MAAANYPDTPRTGDVIHGLDAVPGRGSKVFHAGTALRRRARASPAGGRVLCVCALGDTVADAQQRPIAASPAISWDGEFHRRDIGWRAIAREQA